MKFANTLTSNWENAFRGLRNPMNSWDKSDSVFGLADHESYIENIVNDIAYLWVCWEEKKKQSEYSTEDYEDRLTHFYSFLLENGHIRYGNGYAFEYAYIGPNDMSLAQRMISGGRPNDKFLRQIFVSVDITAPLYLWKEIDTYKIGTVANSASTMHKLASTPITLECFETGDYNNNIGVGLWPEASEDEYVPEPNYDELIGNFGLHENSYNTREAVLLNDIIKGHINFLERLRRIYLETKDIRYWKELIRWLPESWLQTRTWTANYDVLRNIVFWRKNHKLKYEWDSFIQWCQSLPYANELIFYHNGYDTEYKLHENLTK